MVNPSRLHSLRGILGFVLPAALVSLSAFPVHAAPVDSIAPEISNISVSHKKIDVIDSSQKVRVQFDVSDTGSGVDTAGLKLRAEGDSGIKALGPQSLVRISGDDKNGRYESTITFPSWIGSGEWYFIADISDRAGNRYVGTDDARSSIGAWVEVTSLPDVTEPTISGSLSATILDISDGPASLTARATIKDAEAGFDLTDLSSITLGSETPKFISVRNNEIQIEQDITFRQFDPVNGSRGYVDIGVDGVEDLVGNVPSGWKSGIIGSVLLTTRPLRGQRPSLEIKPDGVQAEWVPPADPLRLSFEIEMLDQKNRTSRIFYSAEPLIMLSELETGTYTARVRSNNSLGKGVWSTYSEPIEFVRPKVVAPEKVTVEGATKVGSTLSAQSSGWTPAYVELTYKWFSDGKVIPGEMESSLVLTEDLIGKRVAAEVTGKLFGHSDATVFSVPSTVVVPSNPNVSAPRPAFDASKNRVVIPKSVSASYSINGRKVAAGTYSHNTTGVVTAAPSSKYYKLVGVTSWKFDNRDAVTPAKPTFNAAKNTVKIPGKTGATYYINGAKKKAGTYKYSGTGTVTVKPASSAYKLAGASSWKFDNRDAVTPAKPTFNAAKNTVKIPGKTGATYYINGAKKKAGTYKYSGTGTVTVKPASSAYKLAGATSWKFDNRNRVTASRPVFNAAKNTVKIPKKVGVAYKINGQRKNSGSHKFKNNQTVSVEAIASSGAYKLSGTKVWKKRL